MRKQTIVLDTVEPSAEATPEELARVLLARFGLNPRKIDGTAQMEKLLLELNERKKKAQRDKRPELAVMPVEEMGTVVGIARQTMYDHLGRWLALDVIKKTSFVAEGRVVVGYELNGPTLEAAFRKAETRIHNHLELSFKILDIFRSEVKKEKIIASAANRKEELSSSESSS